MPTVALPTDVGSRAGPTSTVGTLALGVLVTGVALAESWQGWPYAPFPVLHACLTIAVPLLLGLGPGRRPGSELRTWLPRQGRPLVAAVMFVAGFVVAYLILLHTLHRTGDARWDLVVSYRRLFALYDDRYGRATVLVLGYLFLGLWPMAGEELFYRGFLFRTLSGRVAPCWAGVVTSTLFGLRHAAQLAYLLPAYPVAAGVAYFGWAVGVSALWCWVYHRTGSLWVCIASHGVNLVLAPVALVVLDH